MTCEIVTMPGGGRAFVCTSGRKRKIEPCRCGKPGTRLCDWKTPEGPSSTCSRPLCAACSLSPAPDKDLCPRHAFVWRVREAFTGPPAVQPAFPERKHYGR